MLSTISDDKVSLIAGVTKDLTGKVKAGELVAFIAEQIGGKGAVAGYGPSRRDRYRCFTCCYGKR